MWHFRHLLWTWRALWVPIGDVHTRIQFKWLPATGQTAKAMLSWQGGGPSAWPLCRQTKPSMSPCEGKPLSLAPFPGHITVPHQVLLWVHPPTVTGVSCRRKGGCFMCSRKMFSWVPTNDWEGDPHEAVWVEWPSSPYPQPPKVLPKVARI